MGNQLARLDKRGMRAICSAGTCGGFLAPIRQLEASAAARLVIVPEQGHEVEVEAIRTLGLSAIGAQRRHEGGWIRWDLSPAALRRLKGGAGSGLILSAQPEGVRRPPCSCHEFLQPDFRQYESHRPRANERVGVSLVLAASRGLKDPHTVTWSWWAGESGAAEHWHGDPWEYQAKIVELREHDIPAKIACPRCTTVQVLDAEALRLDGAPLKYRIDPR
jgi:hypothetical protein